MFDGMRNNHSNVPVNISYSEFGTVFAFYVFDLTAHGHAGCLSASQNGTIRIEAKFSIATAAATNIICYAEFDDVFEIDSFKNTSTFNY